MPLDDGAILQSGTNLTNLTQIVNGTSRHPALRGGPVLYGQVRVGQFGKPFRIWKFRSMVRDADKLGLPLTPEADNRITPLGVFLRRFKLDELPQYSGTCSWAK